MNKPNLVFVCTENSARSLMAEAIARQKYSDRFNVFSVGTAPTVPDERAIKALQQHGFITEGLCSKSFAALENIDIDYTIILCDKAKQECAQGLIAKHILSWDFPDPKTGKTIKAFDTTIHELADRLKMFVLLYDKQFN
ncbi:arsenate reductase ArsC [Shewanella sp. SM23]|uniref:arsenate reductase ArsC n=1 Tax=Shewanella sp. SM23 TaxID=2912794 RepID=UPI001C73C191|nr:arsenate reductase ArsC [Shewanella sp. SM23]MCU8082119.1 arsenate reductase ArsC [Shewanella sp. SM23]QYX67036.1 arsenate reductase ArsC [Shewanella putrefaciens]